MKLSDGVVAPLIGHRLRNAWEKPRPFFRSHFTMPAPSRMTMHSGLASIDDVRRLKGWEVSKPQASSLHFGMAELPRLDALCELFVVLDTLFGVFVHDRVFDADAIDRSIPEGREQGGALVQFGPHVFDSAAWGRNREPPHAAVAKPCAWRVRYDEQIPSIIQIVSGITADMSVAAVLGRQEIAGPRIMASIEEGIADGA
jgi:hypothetical protein